MLSKTDGPREGATVTMVLTVAYLGLMLWCLWVAIGERDSWTKECRQHSNDCRTAAIVQR